MPGSEFDDFVRRQKARSQDASEFDVGRRLDEWREYLAILYRDIEKYMAAYLAKGEATIEYRDVELNEEFSGPYAVPQMSLSIGPSVILFRPIGTMLIGSKGRVDVQGPLGSARLVLIDRKVGKARELFRITISVPDEPAPAPGSQHDQPVEWAWKLATPAPNIRFTDLDEESFFEMILSIADA